MSPTPAPDLTALGWDEGWASALDQMGEQGAQPARVSRVDRGVCTVMTGSAEVRVVDPRHLEVAVGDWVAISAGADGTSVQIVGVLPRRSGLRRTNVKAGSAPRVVAANVDTVFVCDALDGRLSLGHLERFLVLAWQSGAQPVVVITKSDASAPDVVAEARRAVEGVAGGAAVVVVSSTTGAGLEDLQPYLREGRTVVLLGLSGAGKSTLANVLAEMDVLATGAVRRDGSGRHTTTHRQLVALGAGGIMIDTPGTRALSGVEAGSGVAEAFPDLEILARACQFDDCSHSNQAGCAVEAAMREGRVDPGRVGRWLRLKDGTEESDLENARAGVARRKRRKAAKFADRRDHLRTSGD